MGFETLASDIDKERFRYSDEIQFIRCDITKRLPFENNYFDYVLLIEAIEHLKNPYEVIKEIYRIVKERWMLIISTPNILNLKSRIRFLFEGAYEFFREPPLDQINNPKEKIFNLHIVPYRYHGLEYLLSLKRRRSIKKGG
ncbi:MAG: methyltransferase domain-containing protein [Candidatus Omnitrophica bacterium]|nr:methyltransferase domain-containing protein [Candidatus Omnitrophota bacterium]